jgi:hypothetical protein
MRADHSWPQRRQVYHATTHVLSGAGSTGRPQTGHDIVAVVGNSSNMQTSGATTVPFATVAKWACARSQRRLRGEYIRRREKTSHRAGRGVPSDAQISIGNRTRPCRGQLARLVRHVRHARAGTARSASRVGTGYLSFSLRSVPRPDRQGGWASRVRVGEGSSRSDDAGEAPRRSLRGS